jgi:hypothetical protein
MRSTTVEATAEAHYARIVKTMSAMPGVAVGAGRKRGFGASALSTRGKIFALLSSRGRFVVKLPRSRGAELVASGVGRPFDPGHGRLMKEWLELDDARQKDWLTLAKEAQTFVAKGA